jgi:hypothetical protein
MKVVKQKVKEMNERMITAIVTAEKEFREVGKLGEQLVHLTDTHVPSVDGGLVAPLAGGVVRKCEVQKLELQRLIAWLSGQEGEEEDGGEVGGRNSG